MMRPIGSNLSPQNGPAINKYGNWLVEKTISTDLYVDDLADTYDSEYESKGVLAVGDTALGAVQHLNDVDWYSITLVAGQNYRFTLSGTGTNGYGRVLDARLTLCDAGGNPITFGDDKDLDDRDYNAEIYYTATTSGTVYLVAAASGSASSTYTTGPYTLTTATTPTVSPLWSIDWGSTAPHTNGDTLHVYFAPPGEAVSLGEFGSYTSEGWSSYEQDQAMAAFNQYSNYLNIHFDVVASEAASDFVMATSTVLNAFGMMLPPGNGASSGNGVFNPAVGDTFTNGWSADDALVQGGYDFITLVHEIGHGLGLAHPQDEGGGSTVMQGVTDERTDTGDFHLNQGVFTVMSYVDGWYEAPFGLNTDPTYGWTGTAMALDIAVLQQKYGKNTTYHNTNTVYQLADANEIGTYYELIWDTGGTDRIEYTGTRDVVIDLRAATLQNAVGGGGWVSYVDGIHGGYTIAAGVVIENATSGDGDDKLTGNSGINALYGNAGADQLYGYAGLDLLVACDVSIGAVDDNAADLLDGGAGRDIMMGGGGNDSYVVDDLNDQVIEVMDGGTDTVYSTVSWTLGGYLENLTLQGTGAINGTGNELANTLTGNSGANVLDGKAGADTMAGGAGNDTYYVDHADDAVEDGENAGTDRIVSTLSWTLGVNFENLTLTGSAAIDGTGNALANAITGNSGSNVIDGKAGADTMAGGAGNDTYYVDDADTDGAGADKGDVVTEAANQGTDTVVASIAYTLGANVENLTLATGTGNISGTGNTLNNLLIGNDGNNLLDGKTGIDTVSYAGTGGAVTVNLSTATGTATGAAGSDTLIGIENVTGGAGDDSLTGNSLANVLYGGAGADTMAGGLGNDTYYVDDAGDTVTEALNAGTDTVFASIDWTLGTNVENLTLTGADHLDGTGNALANILTGNGGDNQLFGDVGNDKLYGNGGDDWLDGGTGGDAMAGGLGNDTYVVDATADGLTEAANAGTDTVRSTVAWTLATNFEHLTLTGNANVNATGNTVANILTGNAGNNVLDGKTGADTMSGGLGNDTYYVDNIVDTVTELDGEGIDTVNSTISYILGDNIENLNLSGSAAIDGTGNDLDNIITGNSGANILIGGLGNDTLNGGAGIDTVSYAGTGGAVTVDLSTATGTATGAAGSDTLIGIENVTGGAGDDSLTGNSLANVLDGGAGADTLIGGLGNDSYYVDNAGDTVTEASATGGTDTVFASIDWTLGANLENLTLVTGAGDIDGTGNSLVNTLTGNGGDNQLFGLAGNDKLYGNGGNDTLDGGLGNDTMAGGLGNDTYVVDATGDVVTEAANAGTDTVQSFVNWTLGANLENLTLTGNANVSATGNTVANILTGNAGNNVLDGKTGADTMSGGLGNDTYYVDNIVDTVTEALNAGTDLVNSSVSFVLGDHIENLILSGSAAINGTGNDLANAITGNSGANILIGGLGNDTLNGGAGIDTASYAGTGGAVTVNLSTATGTATGAAGSDTLIGIENVTGGDGDDTLTGSSAANVLDGGAGADTLAGGLGNDIYHVDNLGDAVTEALNAGTDLVYSSVDWTLGSNIENLTLTGADHLEGVGNALANTLTGNAGDNQLFGDAGADKLYGNGGNDTLDGGLGNDTLAGGLGDDTYVVDATGDVVTEVNDATPGNVDLVQSSATFTLGSYIENLTLTGGNAINGTGNTLANAIVGNAAANTLKGGAGNDTLTGGGGADKLYGDAGNDIFVFAAGAGADTIYGWEDKATGSQDVIDLTGYSFDNWEAFRAVSTFSDTSAGLTIALNDGADTILLSGIHNAASLGADDFRLA